MGWILIAVQKDFGYSDATPLNNERGRVNLLFEDANKRLKLLSTVKSSYQNFLKNKLNYNIYSYDNITIPTYVINLKDRTERLEHIKQQFIGKPEFDVNIIEATKHEIGALGLWISIRKVIQVALDNDDDVIIICEDDHQFTEHYSKNNLIRSIFESHEEGATYISGGTGSFENAIPITENRFWVGHCLSSQFTIIFKKFFSRILEEPYDENIVADLVYSRISLNKMILYPFISTQKNFGYSDITSAHKEDEHLVERMFFESNLQLKKIQQTYLRYQSHNKELLSE